MSLLEQCEAAMRSGAGPYSSVYVGSGHPYVSDHDLAEWLRPHDTEEIRQHAIALGDVQRARNALRPYQRMLQPWGVTLTLQRLEDGLLHLFEHKRLHIVPYSAIFAGMRLHHVIARLQRFASLTPSWAEQRFRALAAEIWGANMYETYLRDRITMSSEPPVGGVLGSITTNGTQSARAGVLRRYAPAYTLKLAPRVYDLPVDRAEGILKHEVLHLGYPRHDAAFNEHARAIGAPLTENESEGGKIQLQVKDGARFKTVREFDTEDEARAFVRSILRDRDHEFFGKKMRMVM